MTLFYLAAAWLAGIGLASTLPMEGWGWLILAGAALAGLIWQRSRPTARLALGCLLLLALGAVRYSSLQASPAAGSLASYNDQGRVKIVGTIDEDPEPLDVSTRLVIQAESLSVNGGKSTPTSGRVIVQTASSGPFQYGDAITVSGYLETPPTESYFSYKDTLARQDIFSMIQYTQANPSGERRGNPVRQFLFDVRDRATRVIAGTLPEPQASLLSGILTGKDSGISPQVLDAFSTVGATHVIAISGSNMVIVAGLFYLLASRTTRPPWSVLITIAGVLLYTLFAGSTPSVVRAAIMVTITLVAVQLGRPSYGFASLGFAALVMTAISPLVLWDVGFQLSFLATLGLMLYSDPLQKWMNSFFEQWLPAGMARPLTALLGDSLVVTIAAQITTTPLIAYIFGRFSPLSLPVNLLIVPLQTPLMVSGGIGTLLGMLAPPAGQIVLWVSNIFLSLTWGVVQFFAAMPFASIAVEDVPLWSIGLMYALLAGITLWFKSGAEDQQRYAGIVKDGWQSQAPVVVSGSLALLLIAANLSLPDGKLHVTWLDTAVFIQTPQGRHILIDGSRNTRQMLVIAGEGMPFWKREIDLFISTRPLADNAASLDVIRKRYHITAILLEQPVAGDDPAAGETAGSATLTLSPGMQVQMGEGITLTAVPSAQGTDLLLTYQEASIRLPAAPADGSTSIPLSDVAPGLPVILRLDSKEASALEWDSATQPLPQVLVLTTDGRSQSILDQTRIEAFKSAGAKVYAAAAGQRVTLITDGQTLWMAAK
jgi:competence protein ComEC